MRTIGFAYDPKEEYKFKKSDPADANAEFDPKKTRDEITNAIESFGFKVKRIGNFQNLLRQIDHLGVDIVFNIAEGMEGRNREAQVPILLEAKGIPYTGSDGLTLSLTLDKALTKKLLVLEKIPTPRFFEADSADSIEIGGMDFPMFVKPRYEGSSKGLSESSRVKNMNELKRQVEFITKTYKQPALIEEFISGYEFTVPIIGNENPEVFAPVQTKIDGRLKPGDLFYTFARLTQPEKIEYVYPPQIDKALQKKMMDLALRTYGVVDSHDFGRVDFRVDEQGKPYVLEINPLPCLSTEDVFGIIPPKIGLTYEKMIGKILNAAFKRYNMPLIQF
jgi:D-alanine-D-alanine ligase